MHPPANIFEQIVSKPRLDSYRGYWKASPDQAVGLYMWNGEVCAEVSKLLSYFEITLRNNIHRELSLNVTASTPGGATSSAAWWDILWNQLKPVSKSKVDEVRNASSCALSPDEIVSRLSFGFWPNMLNWIAKQRIALLPRVLPAHALSQSGAIRNWWTPAARKEAIRDIFELKEIRNRIAHHEPLWKFSAVMDTSPPAPALPILLAHASVDEATTLNRFVRLLDLYDEAIHALSPQLFGYIISSSWRARLDFLLSSRGIDRFKAGSHVVQQSSFSALALRQQFASVIQGNKPIRLIDLGGEGIFTPA